MTQTERELKQIPVNMICPDPRKLRVKIPLREIAREAAKIRNCFGAPLPVCEAPACDLYMLLGDEARFRAALFLGLKLVPCEIFDGGAVFGAKTSLGDPRFLFNSIERLVQTSKRAGIDAESVTFDDEASSGVTVTVKKRPP